MRCGEWEERVALWAGGDLDAGAAAAVERHLAECAGCRAFAEEMRESLAMLHQAHTEEIPAAAYTAVRARVLERVVRPRRRWAWAWAAAAILLLAAEVEWKRPARPQVTAHAVVGKARSASFVPAPDMPARKPALQAKSLLHAQRRRRNETILVKIETGNPDVVIYWIADVKGEE